MIKICPITSNPNLQFEISNLDCLFFFKVEGVSTTVAMQQVMLVMMICIIQTFRNVLFLTYLDAGLLA
jgi:hypothetical protein